MSDPILQLNQVIMDISMSDSYYRNQMANEVNKIYENYDKDVQYMGVIHNLINDVRDSSLTDLEKNVNHKKKQQDIQEYYNKQYQQQIFLLKLLILFSLISLVGCLFFNYGLITVVALAIYLGLVFSIGFVVFFYYLWDFFLRDNTNFDEYNFVTYLPPKTKGNLKNQWSGLDLSANNILC